MPRATLLLFLLAIAAITGIATAENNEEPVKARDNEPIGKDSRTTVTKVTETDDPIRTGETRYGWNWLIAHYDKNGDGRVGPKELPVADGTFARLDRTWDGTLTPEDFDWSAESALCRQKETTFALFKSVDADSDGRLTSGEVQAVFAKLAKDKNYLDEEDLEKLIYLPRVLKTRNEQKHRTLHITFQADDQGKIPMNLPKPGKLAPDFKLKSPDGSKIVRLSSFRNHRPVVLIFGCLTCGNYRTYSESLEVMYRQHKKDVEFLRVYVREAHPVGDRPASATNSKAGILIKQPATFAERCEVADRCTQDLHIETPMVVDGIDNQVGRAYGGWPDRLYLIDREGRVVYQGGPGPFAFNPRELEQSLLLMQLDHEQATLETK